MNCRVSIVSLSFWGVFRWGGMVILQAILCMVAKGQGSLPAPPEGFTWQSQGVMVYSDSGAFTVDLGQNKAVGESGSRALDETIQLNAFDATAGLNEHVLVYSSTYSVILSGLGSVVLINLDGVQAIFDGAIGLNGWVLGGAGSAGPQRDGFGNPVFSLDAGSAGLFDDGAGLSALGIALADGGTAPSSGGVLDFDFNGTYDVDMSATTANGLWFATGSARGSASVQTVYERFELVAVPEPGVVMLLLVGVVLGLRRRRGAC